MTICRAAATILASLGLVAFPAIGQPLNAASDLLEAEKAFEFSARLLDSTRLEVTFRVADGYYMYRDKFRFNVDGRARLGPAEFPAAIMHSDPLFGEVATYRKMVSIRIPVLELDAGGTLALTAISQGCADVGVCYTPMKSQARLAPGVAKETGALSTILKP